MFVLITETEFKVIRYDFIPSINYNDVVKRSRTQNHLFFIVYSKKIVITILTKLVSEKIFYD